MSSKSDRPLAEAFKHLTLSSQAIEYAVVRLQILLPSIADDPHQEEICWLWPGEIDAFSEGPFGGNPAAVVLLSDWKDDTWLQNVAAEFNLSETAYIVKKEKKVIEEEEDSAKDQEEKDSAKDQEEKDSAKDEAESDSAKDEKDTEGKVESKPDEDAKPESKDDSDSTTEPKHVIHEYELRWFTPATEVDLCGHATLASAHLLYSSGLVGKKDTIFFHTKGGLLSTRSVGPKEADSHTLNEGAKTPEVELVELNFPWITTTPSSDSVAEAIPGILSSEKVVAVGKASDYLIVELASSEDLDKLQPNMQELLKFDSEGLIATAPGAKASGFDFVSRCFFPKLGVNEDPVTGSAHSILAPYWTTRLKKEHMLAFQASKRGGTLTVQVDKKIGRVYIRGQATLIMTGVLVK